MVPGTGSGISLDFPCGYLRFRPTSGAALYPQRDGTVINAPSRRNGPWLVRKRQMCEQRPAVYIRTLCRRGYQLHRHRQTCSPPVMRAPQAVRVQRQTPRLRTLSRAPSNSNPNSVRSHAEGSGTSGRPVGVGTKSIPSTSLNPTPPRSVKPFDAVFSWNRLLDSSLNAISLSF